MGIVTVMLSITTSACQRQKQALSMDVTSTVAVAPQDYTETVSRLPAEAIYRTDSKTSVSYDSFIHQNMKI